MKFYICNHCKNIITYIDDKKVVPMCCGEKMQEIIPGTVDAAREKHIPDVKVEGNIVKVHVHTKTPYLAMEYAQRYGEFITFKMENMSIQHNEVLLKEMPIVQETIDYAIVCVASSDQIGQMFENMGCSYVIKGGQTLNPSAEDFINAYKAVHSKNIIVFPNNGNVILTAKQSAAMYEDANVYVVESKSMIDAYCALPMIDFENASLEENIETIKGVISNVISAEVSIAVRDSKNNGIDIKEGDYIGISGGEVKSTSPSLIECSKLLFNNIEDFDEKSIITVFYGHDIKDEVKDELRAMVEANYRMMDFVEVEGGQQIYQFLFAIE